MNTQTAVATTAVGNLHSAICAGIDLGRFTPNHANGERLRVNLLPDGTVNVEKAVVPTRDGLSFEFTVQRKYGESDYNEDVSLLTLEALELQDQNGLVVDGWISGLLAKN